MAKKKEPGTALVSLAELEKQLAVKGQAQLDAEPLLGTPIIRTRGKKFSVEDNVLPNPLRTIVVGYSALNAFYDSDYDPDTPAPPACYAVGEVSKISEMAPAANSPKKQAEKCQGCPQNAFGTADKGKGKACRNMRRVAVILPDEKKEVPTIALLTLPPSAYKEFTKYVQQVAKVLNRSLHGVITDWTFDETKDFPCPVPKLIEKINDVSLIQKALAAGETAEKEVLYQLLNTDSYGENTAKPKGKAKTAAKGGKKSRY